MRKKGLIKKTWERCKSFRGYPQSKETTTTTKTSLFKSKSWAALTNIHSADPKAAVGSFPVYVGPNKERFVVRTEYVNHPLFGGLLEEAEMEYGFCSDGPILLPCDVQVFEQVMGRVMEGSELDDDQLVSRFSCSFPAKSPGPYYSRLLA